MLPYFDPLSLKHDLEQTARSSYRSFLNTREQCLNNKQNVVISSRLLHSEQTMLMLTSPNC